MGILSDAGWLEEDVPALHDLTPAFVSRIASGFNNTLCAIFEPWLSNRQGDVVSLHRERREEDTKDKILAEGVFRRKGKSIYQFGVPLLSMH